MIRSTSISTYREITDNGLLSKKRLEVYQYLFKHGPLTGAEVSVKLRNANSVSETVRNRITELVKLGVVYEVKEVQCPITKRTVIQFDTTDRMPVEYEKPKTKSQIIIELKQRLKDCEKVVVDCWKLGEPAKDLIRPYVEKYKKRTI